MSTKEVTFRAKIASGRQIFIPSRLEEWERGEEVIVTLKKKKEVPA